MALDTNIAMQARPVQFDGPLDMAGKAMTLRQLANQGELQGVQIQQARQQQEQERTLADLYRGSTGADGNLDTQGLLRGMAQSGLGAKIPGFQKQLLEADEARGKVDHQKAQTQGLQFDLMKKRLDAGTAVISSVLARSPNPTHDEVYQAISTAAQQYGLTPKDQANMARGLPGDPARLRDWLMSKGTEIMSASERMKAMTPQFEKIDAGNRVVTGTTNQMNGQFTPTPGGDITKAPEGFIVGSDGRLSADPGYVAAKSQIARAGATNLNVNATKPLINTMAEGLGKQLDDSLSGAQTAQQTIATTQKLQSLLNSGKLIAGPGADARIVGNQIAQALGIGGANDEERLASTRQAIQNLAALELQAGASMKGQGAITESERAILKSAAAGSINMTVPELKALSQTLEDRAYKRIETHQAGVKRLEAIPEAKQLIPFYSIDAPPRAQVVAPATDWKGAGYSSKAQAVQDALRAIQRGADKAAVIQRLESAGITGHGIK